jgi:hypothetical protein
MPDVAPLLVFALLAGVYAVYRLRRARSTGDRALAGLAAVVTVAAIALSVQAVAAAHTPVPVPVPAPGCARWVASASVGPGHLSATGHAVCLPSRTVPTK